jgi:putative ABC transport system ATP-binding protein
MSNLDPPGSRPLIQVREACKTYTTGATTNPSGSSNTVAYPALRGVSLEICQGEFVVIMGPSGSGKSTLLHLLGGLDNPTSGQVLVAGQALHALNETQLALFRRKHVGFVFQSFNLIANLTVRDNVELPGLLYGRERPSAIAQRAGELLETLGIASQSGKLPAQLSGGQRQRVAIARALINTPDILLADEPTGNLDSAGAADVMRLFSELNQQGQTIVMVSHDSAIAAYAGRIVFVRDGYVAGESGKMSAAEISHQILFAGFAGSHAPRGNLFGALRPADAPASSPDTSEINQNPIPSTGRSGVP